MRITGSEHGIRLALLYMLNKYGKVNYLGRGCDPAWTDYPKTDRLMIPMTSLKVCPTLMHRTIFGGNVYLADRRMRLFHFGSMTPAPSHNMCREIFPASKYAPDKWPKEILPMKKGKPCLPFNLKAWTPCFSAQATVDIAVENLLELMSREPHRKNIGLLFGDWDSFCDCEKCLKVVNDRHNRDGYAHYSDLYFKWANQVAEKVSAKYPDLMFNCYAYRETTEPPAFKVHKNIIPELCFESYSMLMDSKVAARRWKLLNDWRQKADNLQFHDYNFGVMPYSVPRLFLGKSVDFYHRFHQDFRLRVISAEMGIYSPLEYVKERFYDVFFFDMKTDPEKFVKNWCRSAVGPRAAEDLLKFYEFWTRFWMRSELRETQWYKGSINNIYMGLGSLEPLYVLRPGEIARLDKLMQNVVVKAETPQQKRRAKELYFFFTILKNNAAAIFAEELSPDGSLKNAEAAARLLRKLPEALKALAELDAYKNIKGKSMPYFSETAAAPEFSPQNRLAYSNGLSGCGAARAHGGFSYAFNRVEGFIREPAVSVILKKLADDPDTPITVRTQIRIWLKDKRIRNLYDFGSFENIRDTKGLFALNYPPSSRIISDQYAADGKYSIIFPNGFTELKRMPIKPGKTYYFSFKTFVPESKGEGRVDFVIMTYSTRIRQNQFWYRYRNTPLPPGKWMQYSYTFQVPAKSDTLRVEIVPHHFEKKERVYFDDFQLICLDESR